MTPEWPRCICCDELVGVGSEATAAHASCTQTIIEERDYFQHKVSAISKFITDRIQHLRELGVRQALTQYYYSAEIEELEAVQDELEEPDKPGLVTDIEGVPI